MSEGYAVDVAALRAAAGTYCAGRVEVERRDVERRTGESATFGFSVLREAMDGAMRVLGERAAAVAEQIHGAGRTGQ